MTKLWKISSEFGFNSVSAYNVGLVLNTDSEFKPESEPFYAIGSIQECLALASFTRKFWISQNGYNPIRVSRSPGSIVYTVIAHFGMRAYELLRVERYSPSQPEFLKTRIDDMHNVICYKSYNDDSPILVMDNERILMLNRHNPAQSFVSSVTRAEFFNGEILNDSHTEGSVKFQGDYFHACTREQDKAIVSLAMRTLPVNLFLA